MRSFVLGSLLCVSILATACNKGGFFFGGAPSGGGAAAPAAAPEPAADAPAEGSPEPAAGSSSTHCCVNKAYYDCPDALAGAQCLGQPFDLMSCMQECSDSTCEDACLEQYGPDPSSCTRDLSQDSSCSG